MTNKPENSDESVRQLLLAMADTTWRMITPSLVMVPAGLWADLKFGTKPWLTLAATVLGLTLGALLLKRQIGGGA